MTLAPINVLLLDDHPVVTEGVRALLERQPDLEVIGQAGSLAAVLESDLTADVIIADLMLDPRLRDQAVVSTLAARFPDAGILVLTMVDDPVVVRQTLAEGAKGYVLKGAAASVLVDAVRSVARGEQYVQPSLGAAIASGQDAPTGGPGRVVMQLTDREREVLRLIALGHTNTEIAVVLSIAVRTVEAHRSHIFDKLGVRSRAELVQMAVAAGLVVFPQS